MKLTRLRKILAAALVFQVAQVAATVVYLAVAS